MDFSNSTCLSLQRSWFTLAYCNSSLGTKLRFTPGCVPHANRCPLLRYRTKAHHRNYPQLLVCYHRSYFLEVDKTTGAGCSHRVRLLSSYVLWGCPATKMGGCVGIRCGSWTRLSIMMVHPSVTLESPASPIFELHGSLSETAAHLTRPSIFVRTQRNIKTCK